MRCRVSGGEERERGRGGNERKRGRRGEERKGGREGEGRGGIGGQKGREKSFTSLHTHDTLIIKYNKIMEGNASDLMG